MVRDKLWIDEYIKDMEIRFDDVEIIALCLPEGAKGTKNSILVQAQTLGEEKKGLVFEDMLKNRLTSNAYRRLSQAYLKKAQDKWVRQGQVAENSPPKGQIYYDTDRNIFYETTALPRINGGALGKATVTLLGHNRVTILSFNLSGRDCDGLLNLVAKVAGSFQYDENYGFGEAPPASIFKTLWFWLFPGLGTLIVMYLVYRWVASEYG